MNISKNAEKILELLPIGVENSINSHQIETYTGIHGQKVRSYIRELRESGELIGSNPEGYFLVDINDSGDVMEFRRSLNNLRSHGLSEIKAAGIMEKAIQEKMEKQKTIGELK